MKTKKQSISEVLSESLYIDSDIKTPEPVITIDGKTIAHSGNFITISGLPKSRKTTWTFFMIASALMDRELFKIKVNIKPSEQVLWIDTEQSIYDFNRQIKLLKSIMKTKKLPDNFSAYLFRKYEPDVILNSVYTLVKEKKPKLIVLDNLTELVINPNDMLESKKVIQFLKYLTFEYDCTIICLLHLGKQNLQTLGNLGSYADRGSQSVLKVTIDKETQISTIEPVMLRSSLHFEPVSIVYDSDANGYELTDSIKKPSKKFILQNLNDDEHYDRINIIFDGGIKITYAELVEQVKKLYGVGTNISKQQIIPYLHGNKFLKSDKGIYEKNTDKFKTKKNK